MCYTVMNKVSANTSVVVDFYPTMEEAKAEIEFLEKIDKDTGFYLPNSYYVVTE